MKMSGLSVENIYDAKPNLKNDIEKLREWVQKQPHFPEFDERYLVYFVDSCYYSLEKTKVALDNFLTTRSLCPEMFHFNGMVEFKETAAVVYVVKVLERKNGFLAS